MGAGGNRRRCLGRRCRLVSTHFRVNISRARYMVCPALFPPCAPFCKWGVSNYFFCGGFGVVAPKICLESRPCRIGRKMLPGYVLAQSFTVGHMMSTSFPLPSSPHWAPMTIVAILKPSILVSEEWLLRSDSFSDGGVKWLDCPSKKQPCDIAGLLATWTKKVFTPPSLLA
jgi:hypothetical protein